LNNALAAIVSNNSGATEPATMYAYQWWADTSTGLLKLRNAANNAWITLRELDGTLTIEAGTVSAPGLAFASDLNTGIYSPSADQLAIATNGVERVEWGTTEVVFNDGGTNYDFRIEGDTVDSLFFVDASADAVGIGSTSPAYPLVVASAATSTLQILSGGTTNLSRLFFGDDDGLGRGFINYDHSDDSMRLGSNNGERARIDSSGRLLVGTSSARTNYPANDTSAPLQIEGAGTLASFGLSITHGSSAGYPAQLVLNNHKSNSVGGLTATTNNFPTGLIKFKGSDGTSFITGAEIAGTADGDWASGDCPGRLTFSTTADGASSPTERMRLSNDGALRQFSSSTTLGAAFASSEAAGTTTTLLSGRRSSTDVISGTEVFKVWTNGDVANTNGVYGSISDIKLKENIVDANSQWDDLKALQVRNYNFKEETGHQTHTQIGLIAQEVELVSPGLVSESPDRDEEGNDLGTVTKSVNYSVLYMKAVKALQEAMERIETLEAKVAALEAS
jgi:hypothetical protein